MEESECEIESESFVRLVESKHKDFMKLTKLFKTHEACKKRHPGQYCAGLSVNHSINCYSSGDFDKKCPHCSAFLLKREFQPRSGRCCNHGKVEVEDWKRLQNPPIEMRDLCEPNHPLAEKFLSQARRYNTEFALGSMHTTTEKAPPRGIPVVRMNGETTYDFRDLYAPEGMSPAFGQCYALEPEICMQERMEHANKKGLNQQIVAILEECMRKHNELAKVFLTAAQMHQRKIQECEVMHIHVPEFRLYILTNREVKECKINDPNLHAHLTEGLIAEKVALI